MKMRLRPVIARSESLAPWFLSPVLLALGIAVLLSSGCAPRYAVVLPSEEWGTAPIREMAVVPLTPTAEGTKSLKSGFVAPEGSGVIMEHVSSALREKGYRVIPWDGKIPGTPGDAGIVPAAWVQETGQRLGAETLTAILPVRYEERDGGPAGVRKPASVAFEVRVYRVGDGVLLWQGAYAETQRALTEDLGTFPLFVKRGGKWLSAGELTHDGVAQLMSDFPESPRP